MLPADQHQLDVVDREVAAVAREPETAALGVAVVAAGKAVLVSLMVEATWKPQWHFAVPAWPYATSISLVSPSRKSMLCLGRD